MSAKRKKCLTCKRSLVCAVTTRVYPLGASLYCEEHKRAFMHVEDGLMREEVERMGVNWVAWKRFAEQHNIKCPCIICEKCPDWLESTDISIHGNSKVSASFMIPVKEPLEKMDLTIRLNDD